MNLNCKKNCVVYQNLIFNHLFQIFSEFIILFVASGAIFIEYRRSAAKEEAKQAAIEKVII